MAHATHTSNQLAADQTPALRATPARPRSQTPPGAWQTLQQILQPPADRWFGREFRLSTATIPGRGRVQMLQLPPAEDRMNWCKDARQGVIETAARLLASHISQPLWGVN